MRFRNKRTSRGSQSPRGDCSQPTAPRTVRPVEFWKHESKSRPRESNSVIDLTACFSRTGRNSSPTCAVKNRLYEGFSSAAESTGIAWPPPPAKLNCVNCTTSPTMATKPKTSPHNTRTSFTAWERSGSPGPRRADSNRELTRSSPSLHADQSTDELCYAGA